MMMYSFHKSRRRKIYIPGRSSIGGKLSDGDATGGIGAGVAGGGWGSSPILLNSSSMGWDCEGEDDAFVNDALDAAGYSPRKSRTRSLHDSMSPWIGEIIRLGSLPWAALAGIVGWSWFPLVWIIERSNSEPSKGRRADTPAVHAKKSITPPMQRAIPAMTLRVCSERDAIKLKIFCAMGIYPPNPWRRRTTSVFSSAPMSFFLMVNFSTGVTVPAPISFKNRSTPSILNESPLTA